MDLSKVPTADLEALQKGDLTKVSTPTLEYLQSGGQEAAPPAAPAQDTGLLNKIGGAVKDYLKTDPEHPLAKGILHGLNTVGIGALQAVLEGGQKLRELTGGKSNQRNVDSMRGFVAENRKEFENANKGSWIGKLGEIAGGTLPFLPLGGGSGGVINKVATMAGQGGIIGGLQPTTGNESKGVNTLTGTAVGAGTTAGIAALSTLAKFGGKLASETLGITTGAGKGAVDEALKGGQAFKKAMRGEISGEDVVDTAKSALNVIKDKRGSAYQQKLAEVSNNTTPIDLSEIKNEVTKKLKSFVKYTEPITATTETATKNIPKMEVVKHPSGGGFAVKDENGKYVSGQGGHAAFYQTEENAQGVARNITEKAKTEILKPGASNTISGRFNWSRTSVGDAKNSKDAKELKQIYDKIQNWGAQPGDNTAVELDRLRRDLDNHWSDSSRVRAFVTDARNTVDKAIKKSVPEYGEMTKGYAEATSLIKDIESGLMMRKQGMTGRVTADQTLRRLTSAMRENFELRKDLVEALGQQGGTDVAGGIAGHSMNQLAPRGLVGKIGGLGTVGATAFHILKPEFLPILAASSPRVMGEFLMAFGKAKNALSKLPSVAEVLPKAAAVAATQPAAKTKEWGE